MISAGIRAGSRERGANEKMKMGKAVSLAIAIVSMSALSASALLLQVGYSGSAYGPYQYGRGGEFSMSRYGTSWLDVSWYGAQSRDIGSIGSFESFCLELRVAELLYGYTDPRGVVDAVISSTAFHGSEPGPDGKDPLSQGTGWLYSQFASGVWEAGLSYSYSGTASRKTSAGLLQQAIWMLENEIDVNTGNVYYNAALAKFANSGGAANGYAADWGVAALNLTDPATGDLRQDVPYYNPSMITPPPKTNVPLPDGGLTLAMLGIAIGGLAVLRWRRPGS